MSKPPPLKHLVAELRAGPEYLRYLAQRGRLHQLRGGDRQPVIVYPGFLATDRLTAPLRHRLADLGYSVHGWELGVNMGLKRGLLNEMVRRARLLSDAAHMRVSLIGWSLGGLYAREVAKQVPDKVRQVITLGTPFVGDLHDNHAWRLYEALNDHKVSNPPVDGRIDEAPPVPTTSIFSRNDGIVAPHSSRCPPGEQVECIEIGGSHVGLPWNPDAIRIVADRLSQPEGGWKPYRA